MQTSILDQPLKITIVPADKRKPIGKLESLLDKLCVQGAAINAAKLD